MELVMKHRTESSKQMIQLGYISKEDKKKHESNVVYSINGAAPTICAGCGVKYWINVVVRKRVEMRLDNENRDSTITRQAGRQAGRQAIWQKNKLHETDVRFRSRWRKRDCILSVWCMSSSFSHTV